MTISSRIPSGTFDNAADQYHAETGAPGNLPAWPLVVSHLTFPIEGAVPLPEDPMLSEMAAVTPSQLMAVLNSKTMLIDVLFWLPGVESRRAS